MHITSKIIENLTHPILCTALGLPITAMCVPYSSPFVQSNDNTMIKTIERNQRKINNQRRSINKY